MRILLTRGSIHRHYLRDGNLSWNEFAIHLKLAWADYTRAFLSSYWHRHSLHALQSLAYSIGLCRAAFKYAADPYAHLGIQNFIGEALERCELVRRDIVRKGSDEIKIWGNVERGEAILLYVASIAAVRVEDAPLESLDKRWSGYVDLVLSARSARNFSAVDDAFNDLIRGFQFAEKANTVRHLATYERVKNHVERLLRETGPQPGSQTPRLWKRLREVASRYLEMESRTKASGSS